MSARSCATTTPSTRATARTGTRSRRARRSTADGGADGPRRGAVPRARRLDAPRRRRARLHGRDRRRRRQHPARARERARSAAARRRRGRGRLLRRRRGPGGSLQRDGQPRGALAAAARSSSARTTASPSSRRVRRTRTSSASATSSRRTDSSARRSTATTSSRCGRRSARFLAAARAGDGPFLLECLTHRLRGHYEGDPPRTARRSPLPSGRRRTRSRGSSATASTQGWFDRGGAPRRSRPRRADGGRGGGALRAREPVPAGRADRASWCTRDG